MRPKSLKPKKQRKYNFETPKNEVHKLMSSMLSPDLRKSKGFRTLPLKKGDTVTIMRGSFKGKSGKVTRVDPSKKRIYVDKVMRGKTDKTEIPVPIHPSNVMITKYITKGDPLRVNLINRRIKDDTVKEVEEIEEVEEEDLDEELDGDLDEDDEIVELVEEDEE